MTPRVLIIDDHALLSEALAAAFRERGYGDVDVVPLADDRRLVAEVAGRQPDVVLLDLHLGPERLATSLIGPLLAIPTTVVLITASRDPLLLGACIESGASGIVDKAQPFDELAAMVEAASRGAPVLSGAARDVLLSEMRDRQRARRATLAPFESLTPREQAVLNGLCHGRTADEIATESDVALSTVRTHIRAILSKLHVKTQLAAVAAARRAGWEPGDPGTIDR